MKRHLWIITLVVLGIIVASPPLLRAHDGHDCDIAGAWVASSPPIPGIYDNAQIVTITITPTDPTGKRFAVVSQPITTAPADFPFFADTEFPASVGTLVRSGHGKYQFTVIHYYVKFPPSGSFDRGHILTFFTFSGTVECLDENTLNMSGVIANWSKVDRPDLGLHNQDQNDDGLPDAGETPYFNLPFTFIYKRLPLMTP